MATTYDLNITQGSSFNIRLTAKDSDSNYINLSGYSISGYVRNRYSDSSYLLDMTPTIVSGGSPDAILSGLVDIQLDPIQTSALPVTQAIYDIEVYKPISTPIYTMNMTVDTFHPTAGYVWTPHIVAPSVGTLGGETDAALFEMTQVGHSAPYTDYGTAPQSHMAILDLVQFGVTTGKTYRLSGKYYIESGGNLNGILITSPPPIQIHNCINCTMDTWIEFSVDFVADMDVIPEWKNIMFYGRDGDPPPDGDASFVGIGGVLGLKDITLEEVVPGMDDDTVIKLLNGKAHVYPEATY